MTCWGNNGNGQLGNGSITNSLIPVAVTGLTTATSVSAGNFHSCAVLASGSVQCWGTNGSGQLGNDSTTQSLVPVAVSGLTTATRVSAGNVHGCAVLASGGVQCWGNNNCGQLGDETGGLSAVVPVLVLPGDCTMDIDGDGSVATLTDILMLGRASMGLSGSAVTQNAVGAQATRSTWTDIRA